MRIEKSLKTLLGQVPIGKVTTYGYLARALGDVKAARAVATMLRLGDFQEDYWKVTTAEGRPPSPEAGKRLEAIGIKLVDGVAKCLDDLLFSDFKSEEPLKALRKEQHELASKLRLYDDYPELETVAGVDLAYSGEYAYGALAVFDFDSKELILKETVRLKPDFPYIPTYLAFRELPVIEALFSKVTKLPSVLMVDGNGVLHPHGFGLASHAGVALDIPTIGVAKSLLCGRVEGKGKVRDVMQDGKRIGHSLAPSRGKRPVYVSPGHRLSFDTALSVTRHFLKYRIPEPVRQAHILAGDAKREDWE